MKKLHKSQDRVIAGVAGGVAEYFGWDKALTRIGFAALALVSFGFALLLYLVAAIVMPNE